MRIAQLAPLVESVPPKGYGGTELVASLLTEELVRRGHEVTLFATKNSLTQAQLVAGAPQGLRPSGVQPSRWAAYDLAQMRRLEDRLDDFDIVHSHLDWMALPLLRHFTKPVVATIHCVIKEYSRPVYESCSSVPVVAISQAFKRINMADKLNYRGVVYNGIDVNQHTYNENPGKYLLFLGRICNDKGTHLAIEFARSVGVDLLIAGKVDSNDQEYFDHKVKPFLNVPGVEYIGEVGLKEKNELYAGALAVIYPITFDEPFGLVMAESIACGTPVIALNRGSVSEILTDGVTAVIANTVEELVARFDEVHSLSRSECRRIAESRFSFERMTDDYEEIYKGVIALSNEKLALGARLK